MPNVPRGLPQQAGSSPMSSVAETVEGVWKNGKSNSAELAVSMRDLEDRRYALLLRGVKMGLDHIGIDDVFISTPQVKEGRLVFTVSRDPC